MIIPPALAASAVTAATSLISNATSSTTPSTSSSSTTTGSTTPNDSLDQSDFMQLLIAQLQNQDPLNPMDSSQFAAQLAQFSSLEQLTQINQTLQQQAQGASTASVEAVSLIGKQVTGASGTLSVQNGVPSTLSYQLAGAGVVQATISDANGNPVANVNLGQENAGSYSFNLASAPGAPKLPDGTYSVTLQVTPAGGVPSQVNTNVTGVVTGVDLTATPPVLLIGNSRLPLGSVQSVSNSSSSAGGSSS